MARSLARVSSVFQAICDETRKTSPNITERAIRYRIQAFKRKEKIISRKMAYYAYAVVELDINVQKFLKDQSELAELQEIVRTIPRKSIEIRREVRIKKKQRLTSKKGKEEKVYPKGHIYDFYKDIRNITKDAKNEVFVIDAYVDEELLNLYLEKIPIGVKIRILTKEPKGNFVTVAQKFKIKPKVDFEVRRSNDCHDRLFFVDDECWVMGQSVKDAGKKPTYLVKIEGYDLFRNVFDDLWKMASKLV